MTVEALDAGPLTAANAAAALALVEVLGARVFPVFGRCEDGGCMCGNAGCSRVAKHPMNQRWPELASADAEIVRGMFSRVSGANIGLLTGRAGGIVVIDLDGDEASALWAALQATHGQVSTLTVRTARGVHLYFAAGTGGPGAGPVVRCSVARLCKGFDVRGEGGFVVAVGSVHETGRVYAWAPGLGPDSVGLAVMPDWLIALLVDPPVSVPVVVAPSSAAIGDRYGLSALEKECAAVRGTAVGGRNRQLNTSAFNMGQLVRDGSLDGDLTRRSLHSAGMGCGLPESEVLRTIRGAMADGMAADPRAPRRELVPATRGNGYAGGGQGVANSGHGSDGSDKSDVPNGAGVAAGNGARVVVAALVPSLMVPHHDTAALFKELPAQRWAVPGLQIGPGRPTLLVGYGASAKTISVQALALAVASGRPIWGRYECAPLVVLHVDYEQGFFATAKRYQRLALGHGIDPGELGNRLHYIEMPRVYLDTREGEAEYLRACEGVDLVIIDALRGAAPHTDENDSAFRKSLDALTFCSQRTGASQLVLHHAGKPKKDPGGGPSDGRTVPRGSSAIFDACGCVLNFVAQPGSAVRLVTQVKTPAEAEGAALDPFELVVSDVVVNGSATGGARVTWQPAVPVDLAALADAQFERDAALMLKAVARVPGGQARAITARCGVARARAFDVLHALVDLGRLEVTVTGRKHIYSFPPSKQP